MCLGSACSPAYARRSSSPKTIMELLFAQKHLGRLRRIVSQRSLPRLRGRDREGACSTSLANFCRPPPPPPPPPTRGAGGGGRRGGARRRGSTSLPISPPPHPSPASGGGSRALMLHQGVSPSR